MKMAQRGVFFPKKQKSAPLIPDLLDSIGY